MYKLTQGSGIIRLDDGAFIPADINNTDYRQYLSWTDEGNDPTPCETTLPSFIAEQKWSQIKEERDRRIISSGFLAENHWFHSDLLSRGQHQALMLLGDTIPAGVMWKTMSGEFVPMTSALAKEIFAAAVMSDMKIFGVAEAKHVELTALADPSTYDVLSGWPLGFGEVVPVVITPPTVPATPEPTPPVTPTPDPVPATQPATTPTDTAPVVAPPAPVTP